ncbi:RNA polymerase primary sigma factor [Streptomyces umbrinus]|uniref:RNA polymerase primary sigma factor n=1 Tax=Streptomyces umbrinus TaxID=67370 RepID=A0ABU0T207_9ACTN|nr:sigma-70 family RNA polymerase sigma factor [Streptomyces umbrinus]MDQ1029727.1 RNA polymerase primary sigma factor [Streptomyces umbrinus]
MRPQSVDGAGAPGMKAALAELLIRLRRAAVDGAVPEHVFAESARVLALGDSERDRLRDELARLGLPVQGKRVHTDPDGGAVEKVARTREENVFPRVEVVRALLSRYADAEGYLTLRVVDGLVRLAGLNAREAAALRNGVRVRESTAEPDGVAVGAVEDPSPGETESPDPAGSETRPESEAGDFAAAVAVALTVLEGDRFHLRPENRLLNAEAEVGLGVLVRGGASGVAREPEKEELSGLPSDDIRIRARNCLVLHNQRLVHSLLRGYLEQGLEYDDLFQHGVLGLMTAARKFDPAKGFKFSTYATWWVRQSITRAIADEGAVIRIPVHMHEHIRKVAKAEQSLFAQGRPASVADVAVLCDVSLAKVEEARRLSRRTDSLDRVIGDGVTLGDFVGQLRPLPSVEHVVLDALLVGQAMDVVSTFGGRDHRILVRRLGLDGDDPSTLDEVGREFGVTRERIRQLEVKLRPALRERLRTAGLLVMEEALHEGETEKRERQTEGTEGVEGRARAARRAARKARAQAAITVPRGQSGQRTDSASDSASEAETWDAPVPAVRVEDSSSLTPDPESAAQVVDAVPQSAFAIGAERLVEGPSGTDVSSKRSVSAVETDEVPQPTAVGRHTSDWDEARRMAVAPAEGVAWLAEYALVSVGYLQLTVLLGQSAADCVTRVSQQPEAIDRSMVAALEVLRRVFDVVGESGQRPEDFFERPSEALVGITPRAYLAKKPLVHSESRLAARDALREFAATAKRPPDQAEAADRAEEAAQVKEVTHAETTGHAAEMDHAVKTTDHAKTAGHKELPVEVRLAEARQAHETYVERLRQEHRQQLAEERQAAEARLAAARADTEQELDAQEEALLRRADRSLLRREQHVRAESEERVARLKEEHREAHRAALRRAEHAEEAAQHADGFDFGSVAMLVQRQRADDAHQRLRRYREDSELRLAALEAQLRQAESLLAERDLALQTAHQRAEAAEQCTAQTERDAWARITELQEQLAEQWGAATSTPLRDHQPRS